MIGSPGEVQNEVPAGMLDRYKELEEQIDNLTGMMDLELQKKAARSFGPELGVVNGNGSLAPDLNNTAP